MASVKELYKKIPKFECPKGCSDCCGIVPVCKEEADNIGLEKGSMILPVSRDMTCKFVSGSGCLIYENRPLVCRLFGVVQGMPCTKGKPERMLTLEEEKDITSNYDVSISPAQLLKVFKK